MEGLTRTMCLWVCQGGGIKTAVKVIMAGVLSPSCTCSSKNTRIPRYTGIKSMNELKLFLLLQLNPTTWGWTPSVLWSLRLHPTRHRRATTSSNAPRKKSERGGVVSFSLKVYYTLHKTHTASVWTDCFKKKVLYEHIEDKRQSRWKKNNNKND